MREGVGLAGKSRERSMLVTTDGNAKGREGSSWSTFSGKAHEVVAVTRTMIGPMGAGYRGSRR